MKIEIGKKYRTRDGRTAMIFSVENDCVEGCIEPEQRCLSMTWNIEGKYGSEIGSCFDLVGEVKDVD